MARFSVSFQLWLCVPCVWSVSYTHLIDASTRQYSIKKKSDSSWGAWITDKNNTHTFTNLTLNTEHQGRTQVKDCLLYTSIVVIVNAIIGVAQESKAEKSLEALQKLSDHARCV